jgi:zinc transporter ZupT
VPRWDLAQSPVALAAGVVVFHLLEQFLRWHHCHRAVCPHAPVGTLVLVADGAHNFIGGLAVGSAFVIDIRLGVITWLVAAAHEVPQELGDFGILVHSGWSRRSALAYNTLSALTFLLDGLVAYAASATLDVAVLVPFAAGTFIYIALADLVPEITTRPAGPRAAGPDSLLPGRPRAAAGRRHPDDVGAAPPGRRAVTQRQQEHQPGMALGRTSGRRRLPAAGRA